jgi:hypothetical protein
VGAKLCSQPVKTSLISRQLLATCAQGALATWAGPVRAAFDVPAEYNLLCGISVGFASEHKVNTFNPGRADIADMVVPTRESNP